MKIDIEEFYEQMYWWFGDAEDNGRCNTSFINKLRYAVKRLIEEYHCELFILSPSRGFTYYIDLCAPIHPYECTGDKLKTMRVDYIIEQFEEYGIF